MMYVVKSKLIGEQIVVVEQKNELDEATKKADELDCALYTAKEIDYIREDVDGLSETDRKQKLILINEIKKKFAGFFQIPRNWRPSGE